MAANDPPCEPEKDDNTHAPIYDSVDDEYVVPIVILQKSLFESKYHQCQLGKQQVRMA